MLVAFTTWTYFDISTFDDKYLINIYRTLAWKLQDFFSTMCAIGIYFMEHCLPYTHLCLFRWIKRGRFAHNGIIIAFSAVWIYHLNPIWQPEVSFPVSEYWISVRNIRNTRFYLKNACNKTNFKHAMDILQLQYIGTSRQISYWRFNNVSQQSSTYCICLYKLCYICIDL